MKKLTVIVLSTLMIVAMLSGCAKKEETPVNTETPEKYVGLYYDEISGRAQMEVRADSIIIDWSNSASEKAHYEFKTTYNEADKRIEYKDGTLVNNVFDENGNKTGNSVYADGTGYFDVDENRLVWHDDKEGQTATFLKEGSVDINMANPWTFTEDLNEALKIAGVEFDPPIPEALPDGYKFTGYMAMEGTIRAMYENEISEMIVSKSSKLSGKELAGDYHEYSRNWQDVHKGVALDLYGDGKTVNLALFSNTVENFSVTVLNKNIEVEEGDGITYDDLCSLIMGMQ